MAKVLAVNISETKGVPKEPIKRGYFEVNHGLTGDAHAGNWHRQVSLLGQESIDKSKDKMKDLCAGVFAENLTTEGNRNGSYSNRKGMSHRLRNKRTCWGLCNAEGRNFYKGIKTRLD